MQPKTLKEILEEFDEKFPNMGGFCQQCEIAGVPCKYCKQERKDQIAFFSTAIREILERLVPEESMKGRGQYGMGFDDCRTETQQRINTILN